MISFNPLFDKLSTIVHRPVHSILTQSDDRWEVAQADDNHVPPAVFLPGQLERIEDTEFAPVDAVIRSFRGDFVVHESPTYAHRFRDVDLVDGVIYSKQGRHHLRARQSRSISYNKPTEAMSGVMYESWIGNRWFGSWLREDCLTYLLTEPFGQPVTTASEPSGHVPRYESLLGMAPKRITNVHFDELILFEDLPNNSGKADRARDARKRLLAGKTIEPLPGVFILRGQSGDARVLENERQIAEKLSDTYGFHILDPASASVDQIALICGQANIIAGVEGSHLAHGLVMMPPHATLFVIQPPSRTVAVLKVVTDRQDQRYAFVVGEGTQHKFRVDWEDIRRTLDLLG
ncbi:Protein of unknown function [Ruegeria halocynthiae]|uniref:Glycosyltransferase 61 catalytic domain-containing protein n=1 Tax=Ruegeria halocynthiae TaxID=985054 RepID=A0A1H3E113_9RHOB|nr:glycosyltransferase family 61 protein [Ruegeria halocynthiae]SDX72356.1 Protein of unknown function [Ruegeria halocynthiae]